MKFRRKHREEVGINLTPLIDVVFLLLIFFMVSTTFTRETQLSIDLPEAEGSVKEVSEDQIEILIDEAGSYRVNGQGLVDNRIRTLQAAVYKISAHQYVVRAMDAAGQMGFIHLSITTRQPAGEESGG